MLNPDYRDILRIFNEEDVEYLLVGAYALAAHGYPRATGDIDLWIHANPANAQRVMRALALFGAPMTEIDVSDFAQPGVVFQIGLAPSRIDLLTELSGIDAFLPAWRAHIQIQIDGLTIPVMDREHLKINKKATGRPKDMADLAWLESGAP